MNMKKRPTKRVANVQRRHPVSIAVSMALLAAAAASAMAAEPAAAPAENAAAPDLAQQQEPTGPSPGGATESQLQTVTGVRESQRRAIEVKRLAPNIQDSITAESIGQLPDTTITDALQRITGVQINRDGGVGTSVDVRGLPQVGSMLN